MKRVRPKRAFSIVQTGTAQFKDFCQLLLADRVDCMKLTSQLRLVNVMLRPPSLFAGLGFDDAFLNGLHPIGSGQCLPTARLVPLDDHVSIDKDDATARH